MLPRQASEVEPNGSEKAFVASQEEAGPETGSQGRSRFAVAFGQP